MRRHLLVIVGRCEQAVLAVRENRRHAARLRRHHRQSARECLENGGRHVVDVRRLHVDVVGGVVPGDLVGAHAPGEFDVADAEPSGERTQLGVL